MTRAAALLALALGCTRQTELLAPGDLGFSTFCPTAIDVFGGANVQLVGVGGRAMAPQPLEAGYFNPGAPDYDATLAGRLQARLATDPDLVPRFGATWTVRSCAAPAGQLSTLTPPIAQDACGQGDAPPAMGSLVKMCTDRPAPLALLVADDVDDGCHGGGADPRQRDDQATYAAHLTTRLDAFVAARAPRMLLAGPATEWRAAQRPPSMGGPPMYDPDACRWRRPDWDEQGIAAWKSAHAGMPDLLVISDLHDLFKHHHPCCQTLGVECEMNWFGVGQMGAPMGPDRVVGDGAQQIVEFWYGALKQYLLANHFTCM